MTLIFISYSRVDTEKLEELVGLLEFALDDIWYDTAKLVGGDDWWQEITRQIKKCNQFIYLMSSESITSEYCRKELELALENQKHVIPIRIRARTQNPGNLAHVQYIDWYGEFKLVGLAKIFAAIFRDSKSKQNIPDTPQSDHDSKVFQELWQFIDDKKHHQYLTTPMIQSLEDLDSFHYLDVYAIKRQTAKYAFLDTSVEILFAKLDEAVLDFLVDFGNYSVEPDDEDKYIYFDDEHPEAEERAQKLHHDWGKIRQDHRQIYRIVKSSYPHLAQFIDQSEDI